MIFVLALAACAEVVDPTPVSQNASPGASLMSPYDAGVIFADVCLTRGPKFEQAAEGIEGFDFTQNAQTGTYYHKTVNLSVKVRKSECSMVYATKAATDAAVTGLAQGTASVISSPPPGITVTSQQGPEEITYFRLGIPSQNR